MEVELAAEPASVVVLVAFAVAFAVVVTIRLADWVSFVDLYQFPIELGSFKKSRMCSLGYDDAFIEDNDTLCIRDGGKPMRDQDQGRMVGQFSQGLFDE